LRNWNNKTHARDNVIFFSAALNFLITLLHARARFPRTDFY